jgi:hypothetical protein
MLDAGGRETLEALPDGIHSGLAKPNARGMFFYFQARPASGGEKLHFWKYYDITADHIVDNRYLIAQLIACDRDTPRVIGDYDVFGIQEKIIADILESHEQQQAVQVAPRVVDPIQQTLATLLQTLLNHPQVSRKEAVEFIKLLRQPQPGFVAKGLRKAYQAYLTEKDPLALMGWLDGIRLHMAGAEGPAQGPVPPRIKSEDLRLICFDYLCS